MDVLFDCDGKEYVSFYFREKSLFLRNCFNHYFGFRVEFADISLVLILFPSSNLNFLKVVFFFLELK